MVLSHEKSRRRVCRWCGMTKWRGWRMDYVWNFKEDLQLLGIDINDPKEKLLPTRICRICRMCFQEYPHDAEGFVRHGRVPVDWSPVYRDEPGVDHGRCKVCCAARGQLVK
ncbi:hypothetical protein FOZ63_021391 [Perkinsus olseni]|uniref:Uncharacterized protein n=1 Tax=Perkinsus olseni TaxID=32597 RepID=A0A7J6RXB3_PEROL|nr:hypothetical protein FOZ63_021391 [Perkinsus olseni]KAF4725329.1 hypothetical protein FOZ62_019825 [Perkinsus olseni]